MDTDTFCAQISTDVEKVRSLYERMTLLSQPFLLNDIAALSTVKGTKGTIFSSPCRKMLTSITFVTTLVKAKATIPLEAKAGVIYQFSCKGCNAKYVGETGKTLKTRMKQHKAAIRNRYMSYLITVHSLDTGHQFAFDEAQIIGQAQTKAGRLFMEAIYSDEN